jgi:hypothetical protein
MPDTLQKALETLIAPVRGPGRLPEAATREAIAIAASEALPQSDGPTSSQGVAWPLTEQAYTGSTYYQLVDSSGLFVFEFPDETEYIDGDTNTGTVIHLAP